MNDEKPPRTIELKTRMTGYAAYKRTAAALGLAHVTAETATTRTISIDGEEFDLVLLDTRTPAEAARDEERQAIADHNAYVANRQARRAYERAFAKRNAVR